jgi:hypothetical protein
VEQRFDVTVVSTQKPGLIIIMNCVGFDDHIRSFYCFTVMPLCVIIFELKRPKVDIELELSVAEFVLVNNESLLSSLFFFMEFALFLGIVNRSFEVFLIGV